MTKSTHPTEIPCSSDFEIVGELARLFHSDDREHVEQVLALYRPILRTIVSEKCPQKLRGRIGISDVVQEGLIRGYSNRKQFRGTSDAELSAWFREIILNVISDTERFHHRTKRDVNRESVSNSAEKTIDQSLSPSKELRRSEELLQVADALKSLNENERFALTLRSDGLSFREIGVRLNRTEDAARMLWGRALQRMMRLVNNGE